MVFPVLQPSWLFSGRNATYPAVQTFKASLSASGERFSISSASAAGQGGPRSRSNKATATQFESRHHLSKLQAVVVENSLDVTRVVMEYLTKKLPNLVVAMPK
jgi:hypothetical protein